MVHHLSQCRLIFRNRTLIGLLTVFRPISTIGILIIIRRLIVIRDQIGTRLPIVIRLLIVFRQLITIRDHISNSNASSNSTSNIIMTTNSKPRSVTQILIQIGLLIIIIQDRKIT